ncbi:MAG TPA: hypothetical protein IAB15_00860 [Candidatus Ornithoclostridium faecigallinarum]|nr:hypothetical protein [Candidatus Ornithoclostridium faecigallinarum]
MRKNRLLLCIALVLVFAMALSMFVACADDRTEKPVDPGTTDTPGTETDGPTGDTGMNNGGSSSSTVDGAVEYANGLSARKVFKVIGGISDFEVYVETSTGKSTISDYKPAPSSGNQDVLYLNPPESGWPKTGIVVIELRNGAYLEEYPDAKTFKFTVAQEVSGVQFIDGVKVIDAEKQHATLNEEEPDAYGVIRGTLTLMGMDEGFEQGEVFILQYDDGSQAAFKASTAAEPVSGNIAVGYTKPDLTEVFEVFNVDTTTALTDESMIVIEDDIVGELEKSALSMAVIDIFQSAPQFDANVELVDGVLVVDITITVPNVAVFNNGQGVCDITINLQNAMSVKLNADVNIDTISEYFDISADIENDMTATVSFGAHANVSEIANVQDLFQKLTVLANDSNENPTAIPLFKWTLPIGNGVASISYDADLVFKFNFSGKIDVEAKATLDYTVGARYSKETGIEMYREESKDNGFHDLTVDLYGMAELKVGVDQRVSFDILAGVLGIGLQAELGNYNRIYGYGVTTNLINKEEDAMNGGFYIEGGFYYDVNLTYGLKIGSLLNISDKADIVSGEERLYFDGDRNVEVGLVQTVQTSDAVTLTAKQSLVPDIYKVVLFDLVTQTESTEPVDASELVFTGADGLTFTNGVVNVNEGMDEVNTVVTVKYKDFDSVKTTYTFSAAKPMLDVDNGTVNKASGVIDKVVTITYDGITKEMISVSNGDIVKGIAVEGNEAVVTLDGKELLKLETGVQDIVFTVGGYELTYELTLNGNVEADQFADGSVWEIFTADQIKDLANHGNYAGITLNITDDIDLGGATIAPIANFAGKIEGNNKTISGYIIDSMSGNNAAFIAVNSGEVVNLTLDGTVKVAFDGKTGNDYKVAGLAAVNNGTIKNVTVKGDVDVESNSLSAFIDIDAAMVVATGNVPEASAEGTVNVTVAFDLANVTVNAGGLTSTVAADGVTPAVDCVNGRTTPIFTTDNIAQ